MTPADTTTTTTTTATAVTAVTATAEVRAAADALIAAFAGNRVDEYFAAFAPDATFLFHSTPQRLGSTTEYRALWQSWVDHDDFRVLGCSSSHPSIQLFGDTAVFSHDVETRTGTRAGEDTVRERETIVFHRTGNTGNTRDPARWLAVHEHLSPHHAPQHAPAAAPD